MRRTKIVATIGPASREPETLARMVEAGMDVARLNFSHADHAVHAESGEIDAEVEVGGSVSARQGLNIPGPADELPAVPEEDLEHLRAGLAMGVDMVALSFVRSAADVQTVREHTRVPLIAKIEKPQAVA